MSPEVVKPEVVAAVQAQDIDEDGVVLYSMAHPTPTWWKRPWSWLMCRYAAWHASRYSIVEDEIDIDETDYDEIGRKYTESLLRSRRHSRATIEAAVLKGWSSEEISHYIETGEQPAGKEFDAGT